LTHELEVRYYITCSCYMVDNIVFLLYKRPETVFTLKDISLLFPNISYDNLKERMSYFSKTGAIKKLRRGIYVKDNFDVLELANKVYAPSYISLETVLVKEGVVFQYYQSVSAVSYVSRSIQLGEQTFIYRKIKNEILLNKQGIEQRGNVMIASKERAFLDAVFLYKNYHFDNLRPLDFAKIKELQNIYESKALNERVADYAHDQSIKT